MGSLAVLAEILVTLMETNFKPMIIVDSREQTSLAFKNFPARPGPLATADSSIEVFNFRKNWPLVRPHLAAAELALERGINAYLAAEVRAIKKKGLDPAAVKTKYDPQRGPWSYASDFWVEEVDNKMEAAIERGDFKWEPPDEDADDSTSERIGREYEDYSQKFYPQPDTPEWYQLFGACHWLVGWQLVLGKRIFPQFNWKPFRSDFHSFAAGIDQQGNLRIIFDILNFETMTAAELIDFAINGDEVRQPPRSRTKPSLPSWKMNEIRH